MSDWMAMDIRSISDMKIYHRFEDHGGSRRFYSHYRRPSIPSGMNNEDAIKILKSMADRKALDPEIVSLLLNNYNRIVQLRQQAQNIARDTYENFIESSLKEEPREMLVEKRM
jgi:hypothetical protein